MNRIHDRLMSITPFQMIAMIFILASFFVAFASNAHARSTFGHSSDKGYGLRSSSGLSRSHPSYGRMRAFRSGGGHGGIKIRISHGIVSLIRE